MPSEQHTTLVALGAKWLKKNGFGVVTTELACHGSRERADVIGFRAATSAVIEVKVSRSDFFADRKKPERQGASKGLGVYRFYLCPESLILPTDLPKRWGLLYASKNKVVDVVRPVGNIWPEYGYTRHEDWAAMQHEPDLAAERGVLYSIARRLSK